MATGALLPAILLAGCTSDLKVERIEDGASQAVTKDYLVYYLPKAVISAAVTYDLNKCTRTYTTKKVAGKSVKGWEYEVDVDESVVPVVLTEPDPQYRFGISYREAASWTKEINFTVATNANGTLQSFNGQMNDQIGPVAVAGLTAAIKIVGAVLIPWSSPVHGNTLQYTQRSLFNLDQQEVKQSIPPILCSEAAMDALAKIDQLSKSLKAIKARKISKEYPLEKQNAEVTAQQSEIAKAKKSPALEQTRNFRWVPDGNTLPTKDRPFEQSIVGSMIVQGWLSADGINWLHTHHAPAELKVPSAKEEENWDKVWGRINKPIIFSLSLDPQLSGIAPVPPTFNMDKPGGLVVRQPAVALLRICKGDCGAREGLLMNTASDVVAQQQILVPQYGQIRVFSEHSGTFDNATLVVSLNPDGSLASAGYHDVGTLATGLLGAGTAADAASSAQVAHNTAVTSSNSAKVAETTAETAAITAKTTQANLAATLNKAQADCLTQRAAIIALGETPVAECQ